MKKMIKVAALFAVSVMLLGACSNNAGGGSGGGGSGGTGGTVTKSLTSIAVMRNFTDAYLVNTSANSGIEEGDITVEKVYSDNSRTAIADPLTNCTITYDFTSAGNDKAVSVSYTEDSVPYNTSFTVNVVASYTASYTFTTDATDLTSYDGTAGTSATYVTFGDWPQTIKAPLVRIDESTTEIRGMFTYYVGSDGNYYAKCNENAYGIKAQYKYSDGTQVAQTSANSYKYFKVEPIKWCVVTETYNDASTSPTDKKLLVAESCLMANVPYYDNTNDRTINIGGSDITVYPNNYEHSKIRAWLNGLEYNKSGTNSDDHKDKGFLQTAFGSDATVLAKIADTVVDNSAASTNPESNPNEFNNGTNDYACNNTTDKIFLLSEKEVTTSAYGFTEYNVYGAGNSRIRKPTDFALANYAYLNGTAGYGGSWWLRSPSYSGSHYARGVIFDGDAGYDYGDLSNVDPVVVPALSLAP